MKNRVWEIDFIRGVAIILMATFHLVYDLNEFYSYNVEYLSGFWYYEGKLSAILFMIMAGISSTFSKNNLKRGLVVFGFGMLLTLVTFFPFPDGYIKFGILHFMGVSMILYTFISNFNVTFLTVISTAVIVSGSIFSKMAVSVPYLFPIGLMGSNFFSIDYYPLLPWFGVFLIGVIIGKTLYAKKKSLFSREPAITQYISYLGKHSLLIYLTHQPMLVAVLYIGHLL